MNAGRPAARDFRVARLREVDRIEEAMRQGAMYALFRVRWCFAASEARLAQGAERLARFLAASRQSHASISPFSSASCAGDRCRAFLRAWISDRYSLRTSGMSSIKPPGMSRAVTTSRTARTMFMQAVLHTPRCRSVTAVTWLHAGIPVISVCRQAGGGGERPIPKDSRSQEGRAPARERWARRTARSQWKARTGPARYRSFPTGRSQ